MFLDLRYGLSDGVEKNYLDVASKAHSNGMNLNGVNVRALEARSLRNLRRNFSLSDGRYAWEISEISNKNYEDKLAYIVDELH